MSLKPRRGSYFFYLKKSMQKNRRCFLLNPYWIVQMANVHILNKKEATLLLREG
jgi:hypothetical protein